MDAATRGARGTLLQVAVRDVKLYSENKVLCSVEKVLHTDKKSGYLRGREGRYI